MEVVVEEEGGTKQVPRPGFGVSLLLLLLVVLVLVLVRMVTVPMAVTAAIPPTGTASATKSFFTNGPGPTDTYSCAIHTPR
jgi:hypothetical protein